MKRLFLRETSFILRTEKSTLYPTDKFARISLLTVHTRSHCVEERILERSCLWDMRDFIFVRNEVYFSVWINLIWREWISNFFLSAKINRLLVNSRWTTICVKLRDRWWAKCSKVREISEERPQIAETCILLNKTRAYLFANNMDTVAQLLASPQKRLIKIPTPVSRQLRRYMRKQRSYLTYVIYLYVQRSTYEDASC